MLRHCLAVCGQDEWVSEWWWRWRWPARTRICDYHCVSVRLPIICSCKIACHTATVGHCHLPLGTCYQQKPLLCSTHTHTHTLAYIHLRRAGFCRLCCNGPLAVCWSALLFARFIPFHFHFMPFVVVTLISSRLWMGNYAAGRSRRYIILLYYNNNNTARNT